MAVLTAEDVPEFDLVCKTYEDDERLHVPPVITAYLRNGTRKIDLGKDIAL